MQQTRTKRISRIERGTSQSERPGNARPLPVS
jgi:hypothetical protein